MPGTFQKSVSETQKYEDLVYRWHQETIQGLSSNWEKLQVEKGETERNLLCKGGSSEPNVFCDIWVLVTFILVGYDK